MRALIVLVVLGSVAHAGSRIVVLTNPSRDNLPSALRIALADRAVEVVVLGAPEGELRLDRAAVVQRAAIASGASAGIWIEVAVEGTEVCVVSADGQALRHAPLPSDAPRMFAAIATSLLDELLAPPEAGPTVNVDVHVDVHPATATERAPERMPGVAAATVVRDRWQHTLLEIGPTLSPATYGIEAELAFPLTRSVRVGVLGQAAIMFEGLADINGKQLYSGGAELRYVGSGTTHFDCGFAAGVASGMIVSPMFGDERDTGEFVALRLGATREYAGSGVTFSVAPMVLAGFRGHDAVPSVMTSLRWQLPM